ncbi:MAG: hypothetical protein JWL66_2120 [Sphingomonadales bacterium]|nr:hypothetical protein [Sphingomonadales bacterium]
MMSLKKQYHRLVGTPSPFEAEPGLEVIYRDLFRRELDRLGEEDRFYPVGGAANYSLLYLILRIGTEFKPTSVLDIGAGESTLVWAMLRRHGLVGDVLTIESDAGWATRIGAQVEHEILVSPLAEAKVDGRPAMTYDWDVIRQRGPFDVMVCDGPNGTPRDSRCGILNMLTDPLPSDFLLLLDDAERPGEQDTIRKIHKRLSQAGCPYGAGVVRAAKTQMMFASGRYLPATFL